MDSVSPYDRVQFTVDSTSSPLPRGAGGCPSSPSGESNFRAWAPDNSSRLDCHEVYALPTRSQFGFVALDNSSRLDCHEVYALPTRSIGQTLRTSSVTKFVLCPFP